MPPKLKQCIYCTIAPFKFLKLYKEEAELRMGGSASATMLESRNIGRSLSHASRRGLALIRRNDMHAILFVAVANRRCSSHTET